MTAVKRERFLRVAAPRVQRVLDNIESLEKCANRANYDYDKEDVRKMLSAIRKSVKSLEQAYLSGEMSSKKNFNF